MSLTPKTIEQLAAAQQPGMWSHRNGLCLHISKAGSPTWQFRYTAPGGKRRLMMLEAVSDVNAATLKILENRASALKAQVRSGIDPLAEKERETGKKTIATARVVKHTFKEAATEYVANHKDGWKNAKHRQQWENTLETYVFPLIGTKAPHLISIDDVLSVLQQPHISRKGITGTLWNNARETANRVRSRIEIVISAAKAKGVTNPTTRDLWKDHHNPASWKDGLEHWLNGKQVKSHFAAMTYSDAPAFVTELSEKPDFSAKALYLTILCATRTNETLNAQWSEFDLENGIWIIPAERMKAGKEHRIPLPAAAIEMLEELPRIDGNPYVFPGAKQGKPLSNMAMLEMLRGMRADENLTVHGFRSAFRDWTGEETLFSDIIAEMALAHTIKDKTIAAYRRGDAFEKRKQLMQMWSDYLILNETEFKDKWNKYKS